MVIDLKLCRFENVPWGFRLIGGADFELPLTVVKVTEGSLAEQAGMKVGDIIVRINDEPASNMTHNDVHQVISKCGNNFFLGVLREEEGYEAEKQGGISEEWGNTVVECHVESQVAEEFEAIKEATSTTVTSEVRTETSKCHEEKVTEEVIAEMMSGEAEILKDHNVIGVNFNRIFPKAGICQSSEVFRQLNEEAIKTKTEVEKEKRKWTTFLQKPERPIPKSKREQEEQPKTEPYKVRIVKQSKPRVAPGRTPTPPPEPVPEPEPVQETVPDHSVEPVKEEEPPTEPPTDSEVPNLEPVVKVDAKLDQENVENKPEELEKLEEVAVEGIEIDNAEEKINTKEDNITEAEAVKTQKTEEELLLEKQLEDVQKQLLALSSLPSTIQATLDAVTKQLADLLPSFKLEPQQSKAVISCQNREPTPMPEPSGEKSSEASLEERTEDEEKKIEEVDVSEELTEIVSNNVAADVETEQEQTRPLSPTPEEMTEMKEQTRLEDEQRKMQEELQYKKQKIEKWNRMFCEENVSQKIFREYTLLNVPNQLSNRVNFLKYQKPEKKIDLEKSEVYKVVHHLERQPRRGIEARPPKVLAEEDVRTRATPMSCG